MIKQILLEALKITLIFFVIICMGMAILFPFIAGMKDTPKWLPFIIYPVTIISIAYMNVKEKHK